MWMVIAGSIPAVVAIILGAVPWSGATPGDPAGEPGGRGGPPRPLSAATVPVRVATCRWGTLVHTLSTSGTVRANQEIEIRARVNGTLTKMSVVNGMPVRSGDTLAIIDDREYRVAFERARAGLLSAQIEYRTLSTTPYLEAADSLGRAQRTANEVRILDSLRLRFGSGGMDDLLYERLTREHESAIAYLTANRGDVIAGKSGLAAAREAFETARLNLEWCSVTAPFPGFVADCIPSTGMQVMSGQSLMRLLDLSALFVDVEVLEIETDRIAVGQRAHILPVGPSALQFTGRVVMMNPLVDPKTRTMKVTIALHDVWRSADPGPLSLRPGVFVTVNIETAIHPHRLLVPRSALLVRDDRPLVFTVERGRAQWHYVEPGEANDDLIEIRSGLGAGDTVIVDGHYTLAHDTPVSIAPGTP